MPATERIAAQVRPEPASSGAAGTLSGRLIQKFFEPAPCSRWRTRWHLFGKNCLRSESTGELAFLVELSSDVKNRNAQDFVLANPRVLTGSILRPSPAPARGVGAGVAFV